MKVHIKAEASGKTFDRVIEGRDANEVFAHFRKEIEGSLGWLQRQAFRLLSDRDVMKRVATEYNSRFGKSEAAPTTPEEFLTFGERTGHVTRLMP